VDLVKGLIVHYYAKGIHATMYQRCCSNRLKFKHSSDYFFLFFWGDFPGFFKAYSLILQTKKGLRKDAHRLVGSSSPCALLLLEMSCAFTS